MPDKETNRKVAYAACVLHALGGLVLMSLCSSAVNYDPAIERFWWMIEDGRVFLIVSIIVGVFLIFAGMLGLFGVQSRGKPALLCFYVVAFVLVLIELSFAGVAFELSKPEVLEGYVPTFKEKWIELATVSQSGVESLTARRAKDFLTYVETSGSCCGFDNANAQEQNPPLLNCNSTTPCKDSFLSDVMRVVVTKCVVVFVLGSLQMLSLLIVCGLTCRREKDVAKFRAVKSNIGSTVKV